jgi:hypothetical protein
VKALITGLLSFAAAEEQLLLRTAAPAEPGGPGSWAAVPLVAHCTEFKDQQAQRTRAVLAGALPPSFAEIDHTSPSTYASYAAQTPAAVLADSQRVTADLIEAIWAFPADLLHDAQVNGRMLWLQLIVRGFWHVTGHLGDYYIGHEQASRAIALAAHAVATARYLNAPGPAAGMAAYNLACALARGGDLAQAKATLADAVALNPELTGNAERDPDLAGVRSG